MKRFGFDANKMRPRSSCELLYEKRERPLDCLLSLDQALVSTFHLMHMPNMRLCLHTTDTRLLLAFLLLLLPLALCLLVLLAPAQTIYIITFEANHTRLGVLSYCSYTAGWTCSFRSLGYNIDATGKLFMLLVVQAIDFLGLLDVLIPASQTRAFVTLPIGSC